MPEPQGDAKAPVSPAKLVLAVVLTVVFIVVLVVQFGGTADAEDPGLGKTTRGTGSRKARQDPSEPETAGALPPQWPSPRLEDALNHDPFTPSPAFQHSKDTASAKAASGSAEEALAREQERMKRQAQLDRALRDLRRQGVKAVLGVDSDGGVAVVGSRIVHVGDEIDGFRVVAIEPDGVVLEQPPVE